MKTIDLGRVEVISDPSQQTIPHYRQGGSQRIELETQPVSLEEAQKLSGFNFLQPTHSLLSGMKLTHIYQVVTTSPLSRRTIGIILKYKEDVSRWMVIKQFLISGTKDEKQKLEIPFAVWEGSVRNRPAAFFSHMVKASNRPSGHINILHCLWEYEDSLVELLAPEILSEEMSTIAESIK